MKKLIFILIFGIFLVSLVGAEENCDVVWPQFGVVSCETFYGSNPETLSKTPSGCSNNICQFSFSCAGKSECKISSYDIQLICPGIPCIEYSIYKNEGLLGRVFGYGSCIGKNDPPPVIDDFNSVDILARCTYFLDEIEVDPSSTVKMTYRNRYLYDENPDHPEHKVDESVGCIPQGIMYEEGIVNKLPSLWIDSEGNSESLPSNVIDQFPTNMNVGETYSYFYSWREIPNINLIKNKEGTIAGYCGGSLGNRKLLDYQNVDDGGSCYVLPTSIQKTVECCYNEDCRWKGEGYVCDPTTFTCSENKPCNSDIECQVIGQPICSNNIETSWMCDLTKPWHPNEGTCTKSTRNVFCCSDNDCSKDEYCNKELGCKLIYTLEKCPSKRCCVAGGNYEEKSCGDNLSCCIVGGSVVGICAEDCSQISEEDLEGGITGGVISESKGKSSTGIIILIVFLVLIGGSIAYYFYTNKKKTTPKKGVKKELETKGKHCTKCGSLLKSRGKFCSKCGRKV